MSDTITLPTNDVIEMFDALDLWGQWKHAFAYAHEAWLLWRRLSREPKGATMDDLTAEDTYDVYEYWSRRQHDASHRLRVEGDA